MLMLSPRWASVRISAQSEIVSEVPPPPAAVSSCLSRRVTAGWVSLAEEIVGWGKGGFTARDFDNACEHDCYCASKSMEGKAGICDDMYMARNISVREAEVYDCLNDVTCFLFLFSPSPLRHPVFDARWLSQGCLRVWRDD